MRVTLGPVFSCRSPDVVVYMSATFSFGAFDRNDNKCGLDVPYGRIMGDLS